MYTIKVKSGVGGLAAALRRRVLELHWLFYIFMPWVGKLVNFFSPLAWGREAIDKTRLFRKQKNACTVFLVTDRNLYTFIEWWACHK
jgi:hypothetical protein